MHQEYKILVTGALGQLGTELVAALRFKYGQERVIASDIAECCAEGPYLPLNVLDVKQLARTVYENQVGEIYHLAALLSATGETKPESAWHLNMQGLLNVLEVAKVYGVRKVFWPSSIAVFGPESPRSSCFQSARHDPLTIYGISKNAGEYWCRWYRVKHGLDVRSIRYPGLISHSAPAGGGTTDYAVDIFHHALATGHYTCFLKENTTLPMLYMPDAVRGTLELMAAQRVELTVKTSYNLTGLHFSPRQLAAAIRRHLPEFKIDYAPDDRQAIADSWPSGILDLEARHDWGWQPHYDLEAMVADMLLHLKQKAEAVS